MPNAPRDAVPKLPVGICASKLFDSITVTDAEVTSGAELAYQYGDAAADAAATDTPQDER